jgi:16S rRNA (cytidine1402-2'-O)-methyltransferase
LFVGFLPHRAAAQKQELEQLKAVPATLVFYLPPHHLKQTLERIWRILGNRNACLLREMTKIHETAYWGKLEALTEEMPKEKGRGEYTLVVEGGETAGGERNTVDIDAYVTGLVERRKITKKEAIKLAAAHLKLPRKRVYESLIGSGE